MKLFCSLSDCSNMAPKNDVCYKNVSSLVSQRIWTYFKVRFYGSGYYCSLVVDMNSNQCSLVVDMNSNQCSRVVDMNSNNCSLVVDMNSNHCSIVVDMNSNNCSRVVDMNSNQCSIVVDMNSNHCSVVVDMNSNNCSLVVDMNSDQCSLVVDMNSNHCSLVDMNSNHCYYECFCIVSDLHLAAELGKALLERNRDLESQLFQAQQVAEDQQLEIDVSTGSRQE